MCWLLGWGGWVGGSVVPFLQVPEGRKTGAAAVKIVVARLRRCFEAGKSPAEDEAEWWTTMLQFRWLVSSEDDGICSRMIKAQQSAATAAAKGKAKAKGGAKRVVRKPKVLPTGADEDGGEDESLTQAAAMFA